MNEAERNGVATMRDVWITGGAAAGLAPAEWQEIVAGAPADERERLLLAIAGQAFDIGFRPAAPKTLVTRPPLPKLDLPTVPERHRPLFRSALKNAGDARAKLRVVAVTESRGFVAHPLDWMPSASELDAPRAYTPWIDWQQAMKKDAPILEALSADNWDEFYPAARRVALADIRRNDPAAARAMLEAKAATESAEVRYPLIELLRVNLSADDAPYLQSLATDRSGKVKQLAARLLGRIGQSQAGADVEADVKELADFIEQGKTGLIRRRTVYSAKPLKNYAQTNRRNLLFESVQLIDLVRALGTTELEFIEGWQLGGKEGADWQLTQMVAESGSDEAARKMGEKLVEAKDPLSLGVLLPRLDKSAARSFITVVLSRTAANLYQMNTAPDVEVSSFDAPALLGSLLYREARGLIANRKPDDRTTPDLSLFGFLATPAAAQAMIADLTTAGLGPADPSLALLRLNAALSER